MSVPTATSFDCCNAEHLSIAIVDIGFVMLIEKRAPFQLSKNSARGFTMIELIVVLGIIMIIAATAIIEIGSTLKESKAEIALQTTLGQMRRTQEMAIDQRRVYRLSFVAPQQYRTGPGQYRPGDQGENLCVSIANRSSHRDAVYGCDWNPNRDRDSAGRLRRRRDRNRF